MKELIANALINNLWFYILSGFAVGFLVASFIVPPLGIISPSVLEGVGEIFAFASLGTVIKAIDKGHTAKVEHKGTTLTVGEDKDEKPL